jgi:tripartite-type tricarboxylate transporter receptor subunit TctC
MKKFVTVMLGLIWRVPAPSLAQSWPQKTRFIVPFPAGGGTDFVADHHRREPWW